MHRCTTSRISVCNGPVWLLVVTYRCHVGGYYHCWLPHFECNAVHTVKGHAFVQVSGFTFQFIFNSYCILHIWCIIVNILQMSWLSCTVFVYLWWSLPSFFEVTKEVKDPEVFVPPAFCDDVPLEQEGNTFFGVFLNQPHLSWNDHWRNERC